MKKKTTSIFTEPYHLVRMLGEAALLVLASIRAFISGASVAAKEPVITSTEANKSYLLMREELKTEETKEAWKRFVLTGLAIEAFLTVLILWHGILGNYLIAIQLVFLLAASIILFGYKPWILRNKSVVSFLQYVKNIQKDPGCLLLWNSLNVLD